MAKEFFTDKNINVWLLLTAILALCFSFLGMGENYAVQIWDESRNGMNAIGLLERGDLLNLYYAGEVDSWHLKPPFYSWILAFSMKLFGFNLFALRFPNAISAVLILLFTYRIITLFKSNSFALCCILLLVSARGLLGIHVVKTADIDGVLLLFMVTGLFYFLRYTLSYLKRDIFVSAVMFSIAILLKGVNVGIYLFGMFLYLIWTKEFTYFFSRKESWLAIGLGIVIPVVTYAVLLVYFEPINSVVDKALVLDIFDRFSGLKKDESETTSFFFFFQYLDTRYNLWNYVLYLSAPMLLFGFVKKSNLIEKTDKKLITLCICIIVPSIIFLSLASFQHHWYFAPILPFIVILTMLGIYEFVVLNQIAKKIFIALLFFTLSRQGYNLYTFSPESSFIASNRHQLKGSDSIFVYKKNLPDSNILLDIYFINSHLDYISSVPEVDSINSDNVLLLCRTYHTSFINEAKEEYTLFYQDEEYILMTKK